jgi:hypothetical protein
MSYLTELLRRQVGAKDALAKSVRYIKTRLGITVSDHIVDVGVRAGDTLTDAVEMAVKTYIATTGVPLPAQVLAASAATTVFAHIDAAIAGAGEVIKANN